MSSALRRPSTLGRSMWRKVSLPNGITCNQASITTPPTTTPDHVQTKLPPVAGHENTQRFREFNLEGRIVAVTGGGRGLGLAMAEALMEAGANVWCLDRLEIPDPEFETAKERSKGAYGGSMNYTRIDVRDQAHVNSVMAEIAGEKKRLDGIICAAAINHVHSAIGHSQEALEEVMKINYNGVFNSTTAAAKQMFHRKNNGSILLVATPLGRCLAMEWGRHGIRVNSLCPGHILTPMVEQVFEQTTAARATWEAENMLGRLAQAEEFRGAALFAMSDASAFMTGSNLVIDGGHTAW
ncbi:putative short chain dehydrogenase/oxidoreductase [Talaromyces proteolyticus]|uniref:Short chain dehydrogenase/oxidoreductase n=1 Tax=Talaromyces proteolyticus TaxID=1131652 RepID=A0AAD4KTA5_9EURO|nr:putative short chain dehydrogenase/oxidoreductase [Talaromyces proteolyticus]KAH8696450.1 putative short chain dehydrogenase/oxidoreductase [Talaromyces proteolyticus]